MKTHISQDYVEDGITQGKMKGEGVTKPKFNVITITSMVIMLMNVEVPIIWKDKSTIW